MNKNALNLMQLTVRRYSLKPPGRKNWPRPMMLGPQTARHPRFPGWGLYYLPVSDNKYAWFITMTLFQFTGLTMPLVGVWKMLKASNK